MKHLKTIMAAIVLLTSFSCSKVQEDDKETGYVNFAVASNQSVTDQTKSNVSDYTVLPAEDDFVISITDASSARVWNGKVSEWDAATKLPVGTYTVTANYGDASVEGFDKPYFTGSNSFTIVGAQTSEVSIPVVLGNSIVKIACTDNFKNYFADYEFSLKRFSQEIVAFAKNETRGAFVDCMGFTIEGDFLSTAGSTYRFSKEYTSINPATAYAISFDLTNIGGVRLTITFNDTVYTEELEDFELND